MLHITDCTLARRRDLVPKVWNYVKESRAASINNNFKHLMMAILVQTCSMVSCDLDKLLKGITFKNLYENKCYM
jgi:hypothetical protein